MPVSFASLPDEVLLDVLDNLTPREVTRLRCCSKQFAQLGLEERLWRNLSERALVSTPPPRRFYDERFVRVPPPPPHLFVKTPYGTSDYGRFFKTYYDLYKTHIHVFARYLGYWFSQEPTKNLCCVCYCPEALVFECHSLQFSRGWQPLRYPRHWLPGGPETQTNRAAVEFTLGFKFPDFDWKESNQAFVLSDPIGANEASLSIDLIPRPQLGIDEEEGHWIGSLLPPQDSQTPPDEALCEMYKGILDRKLNLHVGSSGRHHLFYAPADLDFQTDTRGNSNGSVLERVRNGLRNTSEASIRQLLEKRAFDTVNFATLQHMPLPLLGPATKGWYPGYPKERVKKALTQLQRCKVGPDRRDHKGRPLANVRFPLISPPRKLDEPFPWDLDVMKMPPPEWDPASLKFDWSMLEGLWLFTTVQDGLTLVHVRTRTLTEYDWTQNERETDMEPLKKVRYQSSINLNEDSVHPGIRVLEGVKVTGDWFAQSGHVFFRAFVVEPALVRTPWRTPIPGATAFPPWPIREDGCAYTTNLLPCRTDAHKRFYSAPQLEDPERQTRVDAGRTPGLLLPAQVRNKFPNNREPPWVPAQFHIARLGEMRILWERTGRVSVGHRFVDE